MDLLVEANVSETQKNITTIFTAAENLKSRKCYGVTSFFSRLENLATATVQRKVRKQHECECGNNSLNSQY